MTKQDRRAAIAIVAHPDDIEFHMAGTLILLRRAGFETHYLTLANGNCGSSRYNARQAAAIRAREAREGARLLGAHFHPSLTNDLEITYRLDLLRRLAAVIREVRPGIVLTHSPQDYMEDHTATSRLAVTAAFTREMPNFKTLPARSPAEYPTTIYHAMPHGLCDELRRPVIPEAFVNTTAVHEEKLTALRAHQSQQQWLEVSQGMNTFLAAMQEPAEEVGRMSRKFKFAEGWRRHLHFGFCGPQDDPLAAALGSDYRLNRAYARGLRQWRAPV